MKNIFLLFLFINFSFYSQELQAQFGILTLIDPDLSAIQPLNTNLSYTIQLKYDAISTQGADNVDPATIDLTVIPTNGIQVISGPTLSADLCTITLEFIPIIDQLEIIICADDDTPFTQGSAALFRSGLLSVTDCPLDIVLNNTVIQDNQYIAFHTIESNGTIPGNGIVKYQAGQCVSLNEGFEVLTTGQFEALIAPNCN